MDNQDLQSQRLDHLGIVAGICNEIGLSEAIDAQIGETGRKVSVGQAVQAMILNGLGFVSRPLYLSPEFFHNKPVELLVGEGIEAADLNDDCLGRALDQLFKQGVTEVFASVSVLFGDIVPPLLHIVDSTTQDAELGVLEDAHDR